MSRALQIKSSLVVLAAWLAYADLDAATNVAANYETPPPKPGSVQWEENERIARERQELYRKHVPIPGAIGSDVPLADGINFASRKKMMATQLQPPVAASGKFLRFLLFAATFALAGIVAVRKFAPNVLIALNERLNPWEPTLDAKNNYAGKNRREEEAFAEFLAAFRIGPALTPRVETVETENPAGDFYARTAIILGTQRKLLQHIGREPDGPARQKKIANLYSEMSLLKDAAGLPEALPVWQMAAALQGLLKELTEKMKDVTPSTLRAVAGGVDLLGDLCVPGTKPDLLIDHPLKVLVVDDDLISRQAMSLALKKTFGQPDLAVDAETALVQAGQQVYDVIFLDVQMPGMDGFELCTKIHGTMANRTTPVIFVTALSDFDSRAKSVLSGGNDLMGKPFLTFEITVKALTFVLRGRLNQLKTQPTFVNSSLRGASGDCGKAQSESRQEK